MNPVRPSQPILGRRSLAAAGAALTAGVLVMSAQSAGGTQAAKESTTAKAVVAAAVAQSSCDGCRAQFQGTAASARAGIAEVGMLDPGGQGGYVMIMGYTGSRWGLLQAGQDGPYVARLPGKLLICQAPGSRTNVRSGPGTKYSVIAKVGKPTKVRATRFRLVTSGRDIDSSGDSRQGTGWYRVELAGQRGWVHSSLTYRSDAYSGGCSAWLSWPWPDGTAKR